VLRRFFYSQSADAFKRKYGRSYARLDGQSHNNGRAPIVVNATVNTSTVTADAIFHPSGGIANVHCDARNCTTDSRRSKGKSYLEDVLQGPRMESRQEL